MSKKRWGRSKSRTSPGLLVVGGLVAGIVVVLARMGKLLMLLKGLGQALGGAVKNVAGGVQTVGEQAAGGAQTVGEQAAGGAQTVGEQAAGGAQTVGGQAAGGARSVGEQAAGGAQTVGEQAAGGMQTLGDQVTPPSKGDD